MRENKAVQYAVAFTLTMAAVAIALLVLAIGAPGHDDGPLPPATSNVAPSYPPMPRVLKTPDPTYVQNAQAAIQ